MLIGWALDSGSARLVDGAGGGVLDFSRECGDSCIERGVEESGSAMSETAHLGITDVRDPASDELGRTGSGTCHRCDGQDRRRDGTGGGGGPACRGRDTKPELEARVVGTVRAGKQRCEHVGVEPLKCESTIDTSGNHLRGDRRWDDDHGASLKLVGVGRSLSVRATAIDAGGGGVPSSDQGGGVSSDSSGTGESVGGKNDRGDGRRVVTDKHHELVVERSSMTQVGRVESRSVTNVDMVGLGVDGEGEGGWRASTEVRDRLANFVAVASAVAIREVGNVGVSRIG